MNRNIKRRKFLGYSVAALAAAGVLTRSNYLLACELTHSHIIEITGLAFSIEKLSVKPGDTVTWANSDIVPHTATADDRSWDTGLIKPGEHTSIEIISGMTELYFCEYHPTMTASLVVIDSP